DLIENSYAAMPDDERPAEPPAAVVGALFQERQQRWHLFYDGGRRQPIADGDLQIDLASGGRQPSDYVAQPGDLGSRRITEASAEIGTHQILGLVPRPRGYFK